MKPFIYGIILGSVMTGGLVGAGSLYDSKGNPAGPRGSIQSYDYYRERQSWLDLNAMRRNSDYLRSHPCGQ